MTDDTTVYAIFSRDVYATFYPNNNELDGDTEPVIKHCSIYNNDSTCEITTPTITNNLTTTAVGYTTSTGSVDTADIASNATLSIS